MAYPVLQYIIIIRLKNENFNATKENYIKMKNRNQETTIREKSVNIKLDDLLPQNNVKGGKGKTVFGAKKS